MEVSQMRKVLLAASLLCAPAQACCGGGLFFFLFVPFMIGLLVVVCWWADLTTRMLTPSCPRFLGALAGVVGYLYVLFNGVLVRCMELVPWLPGVYSFFLFSALATSFFAVLPGLALAAVRRRL